MWVVSRLTSIDGNHPLSSLRAANFALVFRVEYARRTRGSSSAGDLHEFIRRMNEHQSRGEQNFSVLILIFPSTYVNAFRHRASVTLDLGISQPPYSFSICPVLCSFPEADSFGNHIRLRAGFEYAEADLNIKLIQENLNPITVEKTLMAKTSGQVMMSMTITVPR